MALSKMTSETNKYPAAKCSASISGFVVQIWLPHHPDVADHLYPKQIDGLHARAWLEGKPEVAYVFDRAEGDEYGYQVVVVAPMTPDEQAAYAADLQATINQAGFQW